MEPLREDHNESELQKEISVYKTMVSVDKAASYARTMGKVRRKEARALRTKRTRIVAAVVVPLLLLGGVWLFSIRPGNEGAAIQRVSEDVVLSFSDGSAIVLDGNGIPANIAGADGVLIRNEEEGSLEYLRADVASGEMAGVTESVLAIPRGKQYSVTLVDGTRVWLNAQSELRFPNVFAGNERRVYLKGEAYFDVTADPARPFIVETSGQTLRVLGTQFNVYDYPGEPVAYTTLVDGSVSVRARTGEGEVVLKPGQQASLEDGAGNFRVSAVAAGDVAAWRDGLIILEGNTLSEVFRKLTRWYNIDYTFADDDAANLVFRGNMKAFDDINTIFEIIESLGQVEIQTRGTSVRIATKK